MDKRNQTMPASSNRGLWVAAALAGAVLAVGVAVWAGDRTATPKGLPDLLGKAEPLLPKGALQVDDVKADPKGYTGTIVVRGVVAVASPNDPTLIGLIDSREARVCKDLHCAKFYLPVKVKQTDLKPWDELNVRGTMATDFSKNMVYLAADTIENLGSIKK